MQASMVVSAMSVIANDGETGLKEQAMDIVNLCLVE